MTARLMGRLSTLATLGKKVLGMVAVGNVRADAAPSSTLCYTLAECLRWKFRILSSTLYNDLNYDWDFKKGQ